MNILTVAKLHSNPYYINRFYIRLTGNMSAGILLDYVMKIINNDKDNIAIISDEDILNNEILFKDEIKQARRRLSRLPFMTIIQKENNIFAYMINSIIFDAYCQKLEVA